MRSRRRCGRSCDFCCAAHVWIDPWWGTHNVLPAPRRPRSRRAGVCGRSWRSQLVRCRPQLARTVREANDLCSAATAFIFPLGPASSSAWSVWRASLRSCSSRVQSVGPWTAGVWGAVRHLSGWGARLGRRHSLQQQQQARPKSAHLASPQHAPAYTRHPHHQSQAHLQTTRL